MQSINTQARFVLS